VTRRLSRVRRIYDADPAGYHRGMALLTQLLLRGRRQRVGEMVHGRLLDVGFGTGLSLPYYSSNFFNLIRGRAPAQIGGGVSEGRRAPTE
jgi:hypothetical protein